ncbi:MAG: DUF4280 domain-containing protein [Cellulosilyticaceae bacterium]
MAIYKVMEGATLSCTLGTATSLLQVPESHGIKLQGKKQATISDAKGNINIMPFGMCTKSYPPTPCVPAICLEWINGKKDFTVKNDLALLNICIVPCMSGGIIKIDDSGQIE